MAPIIDPNIPAWRYKFYCKWWGNQKYLGLTSRFHDLWLSKDCFKLWLVRSEEERHYTNYCLERPQEIIKKIPLHFRIPPIQKCPSKKNFVSTLVVWLLLIKMFRYLLKLQRDMVLI